MSHKRESQSRTENTPLKAPGRSESRANHPSDTETLPQEDTTKRERTEDALRASEARYRRVFETAKDGILLLDARTGVIIDVNPFLEDMLGFPRVELMGKTLWEIGSFRDISASQRAFQELQRKEYIRYENLPLQTRAGEQRQVEFVSNVYSANGTRVIQCNIREITERKRAEAAMLDANEELSALVTELKGRDRHMQLIGRMNDMLQSCTSQDEAYKVIGLIMGDLFPGYNGCLATFHAEDQCLETVANWGVEAPMQLTFSLEDCWAMRSGRPHEVLDPQTGMVCNHFIRPPKTNYVCVPLTVQGETQGLLCFTNGTVRPGEKQVSQQQLAVAVGEAAKLSLSNVRLRERLREQVIHDPLTGLFTRRYLEESLGRELHRAHRGNAPLCVAMLDLDHFKQLNDTFGHESGDFVLHEFGQMLLAKVRKSDLACRYGGEEFVIVLPDSSLADTWQRVEQFRVLVKQMELRYGEQRLSALTMSAGVAAYEPGATVRELLRAADNALYAAKQAGRDRVAMYEASERDRLESS